MVNNITLQSQHPDKKRMEYFLNRVPYKLGQVPFEWQTWHKASYVESGFRFVSITPSVTITVLLTDSYFKAQEVAKANGLPLLATAAWSLNGDLLYLVESDNPDLVSELLGLFAGEE